MEIDILVRLRADPGHRTLGQLLQEREAAAHEIERLRLQLERKRIARPACAGQATVATQRQELLRLRDVCQLVGLSRSTIYKRLADHQFPKPIRLGRMVRWPKQAVTAWWQAQEAHEPNALGPRAGQFS